MAHALQPVPVWSFHDGRWQKQSAAASPPPPQAQLTLLTWNVWFSRYRFAERTEALLDDLAWRAPDVVALQEVTEELLEVLVHHPHIRSTYRLTDVSCSTFERYGVLILSKLPILSAGILPLPSEMGRRLLVAKLANELSVATIHLESTSSCISERVTQLGIIQPFLVEHFPEVVLMGDMNFGAEARIETAALDPSFVDAWNSNRFASPGYTVDTARNDMRRRTDDKATQQRIDRVFVRSARWRTEEISLTGITPIDHQGTFTSDHFGLETLLGPIPP